MNLINTKLGEVVIEEAVKYTLKDPENNIRKLIRWSKKFCIREKDRHRIDRIDSILNDTGSNWNLYGKKLLRDIHPNVIKKILVNLFFNATIFGMPARRENEKTLECNVPWAIIMDMADKHCQTGEMGPDGEGMDYLDNDVIDKTIREGKQLGIYCYGFSGAEPLGRKRDIISLCKRHEDCMFLVFTEGIHINWDFAFEIQQLGNLAVALVVDGPAEQSDAIRGEGSYETAINAMETLREFGCLFGFLTFYNNINTETVASQEYIDLMIEKGCKFGFYFNYIPMEPEGKADMMATVEQRALMHKRAGEIRSKSPIPVLDFNNDHQLTNGCMGAGRKYFHINAKGDCEPCSYVHYSDRNIRESSLAEVLKSPLFKCYEKRQPFSRNPLRGCPLLDKPEKLRAMLAESKAQFTGDNCEASLEQLEAKLEKYRKAWSKKAGELL